LYEIMVTRRLSYRTHVGPIILVRHVFTQTPGRFFITLSLRLFCCFALAAPLIVPLQSWAAEMSENARLSAFFEEVHQAALARWPEWQTSLGLKTNNDRWNDRSEARGIEEHEIRIRNLTRLRRDFDYGKLDSTSQLSYRLFEHGAELSIAWFPFRHHWYPVTQMGGPHTRVPSFLINRHSVAGKADAEAYIKRLEGMAMVMDQTIDRLERHARKDIIAPRFVFPKVLEDIDKVLSGAPFDRSGKDTAIRADFVKKITALDLPDAERADLVTRAERALLNTVRPAYERLRAALSALEQRATNDDGVWKFPDGKAFYRLALHSKTTTDLTPEAVHDYGLAEVARIHDEMRRIVKALDFDGDLAAFFEFIRHDPSNFYPNTSQGRTAYLADTDALIAEMDRALHLTFAVKPKADLVVKRVEPYREKTANLAFYRSPAVYGDRPGMYYVNLHDMRQMPKSHMEGLAYHEAIPGHHMQIALARELKGLPKFRRFASYTAYSEGWALYAERLAKEMGFYRAPLSDFGRLAWELLRAARLVVDTGLHHKRWSREQAIAYLDTNLPASHENNRKSIERYVVWPAQATAYKIGMRKILELRQRAQDRLGSSYDVRAFHSAVLGNGGMPLGILDSVIERWIQAGGR